MLRVTPQKINKYFELKKLVGLPPQLELLAVASHKLGHDNMSEQCNNICPYSMGTQTQTDCACIFLYLNPSSFGVVSKQSG